jgi:uncharacterized protein (UPF0335 family)
MMKKALMIGMVALGFIALGRTDRGYAVQTSALNSGIGEIKDAGGANASPQESISGDWTAKVKQTDRGPVLWLSINGNRDSRRGRFQENTDIPLQEFSGLNPNANSNTRFSLRRESGVVEFEGLFQDGRGVGEFKFTPSGGFTATMRGLGYDDISLDDLFVMTTHDIGTRYINELKSLGYDKLPLRQIISLRVMGVTGEFIKEARGWGYGDLSDNDLIEIKAMGINPEYARSMKALGFDNLSLRKLIELKAMGINEKYVNEARAMGFDNLSANQIVEMKAMGINGAFVRELREVGYDNLKLSQLIELKAMGINADYVKKMRAAGLKNVSVSQLIELKATGVDKALDRNR